MMSPCFSNMKYLIFPMLLELYKPIYLPPVQLKFASRFNIEIFFLLNHIMKTLPLTNSPIASCYLFCCHIHGWAEAIVESL